jgi:Ca2+-binding RTX toxin-like protein
MAIFLGTPGNDTIAPDQAPGTAGVRLDGVVQDPNIVLQAALFNGADNITGDSGNDNLGGGDGIDILVGEEGDDTLSGGNGFGNTLNGGPGKDWASYKDVAPFSGLTVNLNDTDTEITAFFDPVAFPDIATTVSNDSGYNKTGVSSNLEFGEFFNDFILFGSGANLATHGGNRDIFVLGQTIEHVEGALNRQNQIAGNEDDNILIGGNLDDILYGGSEGADILRGGAANDSYVVDPNVVGGIADAAGTVIEDTAGGTDRLGFFDFPFVTVVASAPTTTPNTIGMERFANDLVLDLNRNGTADAPEDLTIKNFYNSSGLAGTGFIEQLGNLNAQDVLTANLPDMGGVQINWNSPTPTPSSTAPGTTQPFTDVNGTALENMVFFDSVSGITSYVYTNHGESPNLNDLTGNARGIYTQALNGHDTVTGTIGSDNINGNQGDDIINGGAGDDGDRTDPIPANQVRTALRGGKGGDQVFGEAGKDILNGNEHSDRVDGGDGNDIVRGGKGDDILIGGPGSDFLFGDDGKDILIGGTLTGSTVNPDSAQDIYELKDPGVTNPADADLIRGFENGTDLMLLPTGVLFTDLTITPIQLSIDSAATVQSSQILRSGQTLALVEGVIPNDLDASDFTEMGSTVLAGGSLTNQQIALLG